MFRPLRELLIGVDELAIGMGRILLVLYSGFGYHVESTVMSLSGALHVYIVQMPSCTRKDEFGGN
jgi:hypothetical protein